MSDGMEFILLNGVEISSQDIGDKLFSSALFYGTGCFETMRFDKGQILRFEDHMNRMYRGLKYLELPVNLYPDKEFLHQMIYQVISESGLIREIVKVRVQCSLLEQKGYQLDPNIQLLTHIRVSSYEKKSHPVCLFTAKTRVIPSECRPADLKLSNMLHYRSAYREALKQKYDEALLLTLDGFIAETSMANIFWAIGDQIFTPSIDCSILPGIMRGGIIESIKKSEILNVEEGLFKPEFLFKADLVWLSNSVIEFQPVVSVDGHQLKFDKSLLNKIMTDFHYQKGNRSNL